MPKPFLRPKLIFTYPSEVGELTKILAYHSFSRWQEIIYPDIVSQTPIFKSNDERRSPGFVRKYIKLITSTGESGIKYRVIAVPGGTVKGTPQYHALMAILSLHGTSGRPLSINAKPGSILTFPLKSGQTFRNPKVLRQGPGRTRGPKNWVVTKRVVQTKWGRPNPWIIEIFNKNVYMLTNILHQELLAAKGRKTKLGEKKIEVS